MNIRILLFSIVVGIVMLTGCSNDEPTPTVEQEPVKALVPSFLETYDFRAKCNCDTAYGKQVIPIEGLLSYLGYDYSDHQYEIINNIFVFKGKPFTIKNGVEYTPKDPKWFNKWAIQYSDTCYTGTDEDVETYRPHPYAIKSITFTVGRYYPTDTYHIKDGKTGETTWPYNENYAVEEDCTTLFRIRYRTYYDYIKNGYSWEGTGFTGPWKEMDVAEFNRRGGDKLIDVTEMYLIAKEPRKRHAGEGWVGTDKIQEFIMTMTFENGKINNRNRELMVYCCF